MKCTEKNWLLNQTKVLKIKFYIYSGMVDQMCFQSHKITTNTIDMIMYASGQSLHLCPLKNSFNMLPKLNHIDKVDPKNNNKKNSQNDNEVSEEEEEEEEESEQIIAKFKDRPGKKSEKKKMQEMVKQRAMEPCVHLNFIPNGQYFSRMELDKFTLPKIKNTTNNINTQEPILEIKIINENIDSIRARQLSHHDIKLYSLENKIKILLLNTKMVSTKTLLDLLHSCGVPTDESVDTILTHLQKIAFLICGNWTIKSEELYPDNTISSHFGLSSEIMRLLRDYIIHLLDSGKNINRKDIGKLFNSPPDEVIDVLNSVAKLDEDKTWRFAFTENDILEINGDKFDAICEEQKEWWDMRIKEIESWLEQKPKIN
ncbi:Hypothetical protein CINCED_3A019093 [Cinara cedri]|uniref:DNA-directed RNA polymerase III subunit RPC5 n=1 Tax=Cinara cedri TaxID=506608 RepID=A0A5E4MV93_9HEMI|nr:Hypothetical protein CINCED_3A019093 [Cinara cedri]